MSFPLLAADNEEPPRSRDPQPSFSNAAETRSDFDVRPLSSRKHECKERRQNPHLPHVLSQLRLVVDFVFQHMTRAQLASPTRLAACFGRTICSWRWSSALNRALTVSPENALVLDEPSRVRPAP
jgi:hypothetical protein